MGGLLPVSLMVRRRREERSASRAAGEGRVGREAVFATSVREEGSRPDQLLLLAPEGRQVPQEQQLPGTKVSVSSCTYKVHHL